MVAAQCVKLNNHAPVLPDVTPQPFKWSTVSLSEVLAAGGRLEASVFNIEGRQAREALQRCKWPVKSLLKDFLVSAHYPGRFKRIYVTRSHGEPFFMPSQINELRPRPTKYISKTKGVDHATLKIKLHSILMTRSGTIGNCTIATETLTGGAFSDDVIRIEPSKLNEVGYLYAFLKSKTGRTLINTNDYGAVVSHIEPEHLTHIPIPDPSPILKQQIHDLIMSSFRLRDESNALMDEAQALLRSALNLPNIDDIRPTYFDQSADLNNYSVGLSSLHGRLEASYHLPVVDSIQRLLVANAKEVVTVGDSRVSKVISLPGRFKRVYVEEGQGVTFFSGKNIGELNPSDKRYLSFSQHDRRIKDQLTLVEGMILVTCSGTVGNIALVPKHWHDWAMTHDIIRLIPANKEISGYLYAWLASDFGNILITRFAYGAVVPHIEIHHLNEVAVPLLHDAAIQKTINDKVLESSRKRFEAYELEQKALKLMDEKVIFCGRDGIKTKNHAMNH